MYDNRVHACIHYGTIYPWRSTEIRAYSTLNHEVIVRVNLCSVALRIKMFFYVNAVAKPTRHLVMPMPIFIDRIFIRFYTANFYTVYRPY